MWNALERRQAILETLSERRQESVANLMAQFRVSRCTILRDIEILACSAPIYTVQGNGGGIRVADGWYISRSYLNTEQEALLQKLSDGLQPDDLHTVQSILAAFGKPRNK